MTAAHGLDAAQYTFNYVAGWAHRAAELDGRSVEDIVKASGQRVIGTADRILQATQRGPTPVDRALDDLALEVGRGLVAIAEHRPVPASVESLGQMPQRRRDASAADRSAPWETASTNASPRSRSDARRGTTARSAPRLGR